ncbi:MAG: hypothetical protein JRJ37_02660 [Deltaproteobacteria bacterium]|nr:hypothetical protein [Deltaproteobacteria bacterium]
MAKKKKHKKMAPPVIDKKILKEQEKLCKKWQAGKDAHLARIGLLGTMKTTLRAIKRYKKKEFDQLLSPGMEYSQKKSQKELKKEIKLIEDIKTESAALLEALKEII